MPCFYKLATIAWIKQPCVSAVGLSYLDRLCSICHSGRSVPTLRSRVLDMSRSGPSDAWSCPVTDRNTTLRSYTTVPCSAAKSLKATTMVIIHLFSFLSCFPSPCVFITNKLLIHHRMVLLKLFSQWQKNASSLLLLSFVIHLSVQSSGPP